MAEVVSKIGLQREKGFLYYLKGSDVWKAPMKRAGEASAAGKETKVAPGNFSREEGYLYFLDKNGNIARAKRAVGGQKRKKVKRTAAKKATKKPAQKTAKKTASAKKSAAKKPVKAKKAVKAPKKKAGKK